MGRLQISISFSARTPNRRYGAYGGRPRQTVNRERSVHVHQLRLLRALERLLTPDAGLIKPIARNAKCWNTRCSRSIAHTRNPQASHVASGDSSFQVLVLLQDRCWWLIQVVQGCPLKIKAARHLFSSLQLRSTARSVACPRYHISINLAYRQAHPSLLKQRATRTTSPASFTPLFARGVDFLSLLLSLLQLRSTAPSPLFPVSCFGHSQVWQISLFQSTHHSSPRAHDKGSTPTRPDLACNSTSC